MTTKVALYCRVSTSTKDQTTENQLRELTSTVTEWVMRS